MVGVSNQLVEQPSRVSFEPKDADIRALDEIAEQEGISRAEKLRQLISEEVQRHQDDDQSYAVPDDEELASAYRTLVDLAEEVFDGAGLRVTRERARNELYHNDMPKDAVMSELIGPLRDRGYVDIDPAMSRVWITVRPLTPEVSEDV